MTSSRKCNKCSVDLVIGENWAEASKRGRRYVCKECDNARKRAWYAENREYVSSYFRSWHAKNKEYDNARKRAWHAENREYKNARDRAWRAENREYHNAFARAYQAEKRAKQRRDEQLFDQYLQEIDSEA